MCLAVSTQALRHFQQLNWAPHCLSLYHPVPFIIFFLSLLQCKWISPLEKMTICHIKFSKVQLSSSSKLCRQSAGHWEVATHPKSSFCREDSSFQQEYLVIWGIRFIRTINPASVQQICSVVLGHKDVILVMIASRFSRDCGKELYRAKCTVVFTATRWKNKQYISRKQYWNPKAENNQSHKT